MNFLRLICVLVLSVNRLLYSSWQTQAKNRFVQGLSAKLRGIARDACEGCTLQTLKELSEHLKSHLELEKLSTSHYLAELGRVKMNRDEKTLEYGSRVKGLVRSLKASMSGHYSPAEVETHMKLISDQARDHFIRGLRGSIEIRVSGLNPKTLDEAINLAHQAHLRIKEMSEHHVWGSRGPSPAARIHTPSSFRASRDPAAEENRPFLSARSRSPSRMSSSGQPGRVTLLTRDNTREFESHQTNFQAPYENVGPIKTRCPNCCTELVGFSLSQPVQGPTSPRNHAYPPSEIRNVSMCVPASPPSDKFVDHLNSMSARQVQKLSIANPDISARSIAASRFVRVTSKGTTSAENVPK